MSHEISLKLLEGYNFGIRGGELNGGRMQFTVLNGVEFGTTSCNNWYTAGIGTGSDPVRFIY